MAAILEVVMILWYILVRALRVILFSSFWHLQLSLLPLLSLFFSHFLLGFVIHMFLLQLFLLGQPSLLYNSYLVSMLYSISLHLYLKVREYHPALQMSSLALQIYQVHFCSLIVSCIHYIIT